MTFLSKLTGWFNRGERKSDLQQNMEKALRMKQEAGPQTHIPEHQTPNEGLQRDHVNDDVSRGQQHGAFEPQLKRTRGTRQGDIG